jgi:hypothetical protein
MQLLNYTFSEGLSYNFSRIGNRGDDEVHHVLDGFRDLPVKRTTSCYVKGIIAMNNMI